MTATRTGRRPASTRRSRSLLCRGAALALAPQPFGVRREPFVEPDVLPRREREAVAGPLVRELVHDDAVGRSSGRRRRPWSRSAASGSRARTRARRRRRRCRRRLRTGTGRSARRGSAGSPARARSRPRRPGRGSVACSTPCRRSSRSGSARCPPARPGRSSRRTCRRRASNDVEPSPVEMSMSSTYDAGVLEEVVAGVADRDLDRLARVRRQVDGPLLVAVAPPLAAHHAPVEPVGVHVPSAVAVW